MKIEDYYEKKTDNPEEVYQNALKEYYKEKEEREDIYRECKSIDKELENSLGYCSETTLMGEELAEFKKQSDKEIQDIEEKIIGLGRETR